MPRTFCGNKIFATEAIAEQELEATVHECAQSILAQMGLSMDQASKKTVTHGEDAISAENKLRNESNPNLH